jgi:hypothetical protein
VKCFTGDNALSLEPLLMAVAVTLFMLLPLCSASLGTYKINTCVNVKTILNSTYTNISSLSYPNSTVAITNKGMTKSGLTFNYTFCDTGAIGVYVYDYFDDAGNVYVNDFEITGNGKPNPTDNVIVLFSILYLISIGILAYVSIYSLGHLLRLDFDLTDLAINLGMFFMIVGLYFLQDFYVGNAKMEGWYLILISIGGALFVLLPVIAFILSITIGTLNKKSPNFGKPPRKMWRIGK